MLVVLLWLINDRRRLDTFVNGRVVNAVCLPVVAALILLTAIMLVTSLFPGLP